MFHGKLTTIKQRAFASRKSKLLSVTSICLFVCLAAASTIICLPNRKTLPAHALTNITVKSSKQQQAPRPALAAQNKTSQSTTTTPTIEPTEHTVTNSVVSSTQSNGVNFTLSASSVTIYRGGTTPTITAKTIDGNAVYWVVTQPLSAQADMMTKFGQTSGANPSASDSFAIDTNPSNTQPGTYTGTVIAYHSGHYDSGVTKTYTITVLPQATFTVNPFSPFGNQYSPNTEECINFMLAWTLPTGTTEQPVTVSAYAASTTDKVVSTSMNGDNGCVLVQFGSALEGTSQIRMVISYPLYFLDYDLNYSV